MTGSAPLFHPDHMAPLVNYVLRRPPPVPRRAPAGPSSAVPQPLIREQVIARLPEGGRRVDAVTYLYIVCANG